MVSLGCDQSRRSCCPSPVTACRVLCPHWDGCHPALSVTEGPLSTLGTCSRRLVSREASFTAQHTCLFRTCCISIAPPGARDRHNWLITVLLQALWPGGQNVTAVISPEELVFLRISPGSAWKSKCKPVPSWRGRMPTGHLGQRLLSWGWACPSLLPTGVPWGHSTWAA